MFFLQIFFNLFERNRNNPILALVKYVDEMALVDCLKDEHSLTQYYPQSESLNCQFKSSCLELNRVKTRVSLEVGGLNKHHNLPRQAVKMLKSLRTINSCV